MDGHRRNTGRIVVSAMICSWGIALFGAATSGAAESASGPVPNLSGVYYRGLYIKPPPGIDEDVILPTGGVIPGMFGPGPIRHQAGSDPAKYFALGDARSPLLKTSAAELVKAHNEAVEAGRLMSPSTKPCQPSGLFMQLTNPGAMRITQTANQIVIEFTSDGDRRVIHMNATHAASVAPSLNGRSIGRWEGDTLVVDTIGLDEKSALDRYGTPHTTALHVVERICLIKGGDALENQVFAEDSPTFFAPWWGVVTYRKSGEPWNEQVCPRG